MRIAIVNDIALAVEAVRRVVFGTRGHQIAWIARDGAQAVELCARDRPDLILMDLIMPRMDGVEATRRIMVRTPCPIVVVTGDVGDHSPQVFEALGAGALDAVNTPVLQWPDACLGAEALLAKIETIRKLIGAVAEPGPQRPPRPQPLLSSKRDECLVAIGASAGGPAALATLLAQLPRDFPASLVVVQHVDAQFAQGLVTWLDSQTPLQVRVAEDGDAPQSGTVLVAGGDNHLVLTASQRLAYTRVAGEYAYRPAIDVFLRSLDQFWNGEMIGVLLTGMGRDGADGLRLLYSHGHHTIVQDQATSAVYGMPKAAVELQAVTEILPLDEIGARLLHLVTQRLRPHG